MCIKNRIVIKKILKSKKGEGFIDVAIGVVCVAAFLALALNIFSFVTLRTTMDRIADDLIRTATYTGAFGEEFDDRVATLKDEYFDFEIMVDGDYYNEQFKRVQIGHDMRVRISVGAEVAGFGIKLPMNVTVTRIGQSERYWKNG